MTDLVFDGGNNQAGNFLVRFVPVVGVTSLPSPAPTGPAAGSVSGSPTFRDGFRWFAVYGSESTKAVSEEQETGDNGPLWSVKIDLFLPGDSAAQRGNLAELVRHRFIVEVEDNTGLTRRFGTIRQNLELTYRFDVPGPMGDRRGTKLSFTGNMTRPAPLVVT